MIHQYKLGGYNIVLDVCSGGVHVVDDVAYDIIAMYKTSTPAEIVEKIMAQYGNLPDVNEEEILGCIEDIKALEAAGLMAEKAGATLLPARIDGAALSIFSYLRHKVRRRWFPRVTVTLNAPQKIELPEGLSARERRRMMSVQLYSTMTEMEYRTTMDNRNMVQMLMDTVARCGRKFPIAEDQDRKVLRLSRTRSSLTLKRDFRYSSTSSQHTVLVKVWLIQL